MLSAIAAVTLALAFAGRAAALTCAAGSYHWVRDGIERCRVCPAGCACPGGLAPCTGCSGGAYAATAGLAACAACGAGTTTDVIYNSGCNPDVYTTPCANEHGPLGFTACRPTPPPSAVVFVAPNGAAPVALLRTNPNSNATNPQPALLDIEDYLPMIQQSY